MDKPTEKMIDELLQWVSEKGSEQVGGNHYRNKAIEPIQYIMENKLGYCEGNVVKYVTRHAEKGKTEDIRKAIQYCKFILKHQYGEDA